MKKTHTLLVIMIIVSVFLMSFLIGRATALRDKEKNITNSQIYTGEEVAGQEKEKSAPASVSAERVEKKAPQVAPSKKDAQKSLEDKPPERMLFPCGENVLKEYSQMAVYSETMGDWRAHTGIDYEAEKGSDVKSSWDGTVSRIYKDRLWGHTIEIEHSGNVKSVYKNLQSKIEVREGDKVKRGQAIAKVGESASVESREKPHLHFELWQDGVAINPISYVY